MKIFLLFVTCFIMSQEPQVTTSKVPAVQYQVFVQKKNHFSKYFAVSRDTINTVTTVENDKLARRGALIVWLSILGAPIFTLISSAIVGAVGFSLLSVTLIIGTAFCITSLIRGNLSKKGRNAAILGLIGFALVIMAGLSFIYG